MLHTSTKHYKTGKLRTFSICTKALRREVFFVSLSLRGKGIMILGVLSLSLFLLNACFNLKPKINPVNPEFGKYISGYTSGMVSRKGAIRIELSQGVNEKENQAHNRLMDSLAALPPNTINSTHLQKVMRSLVGLRDSSLLKNVFSFEPAIKGHAIWISDRVIEFIPDEALPPNQFYNAEFKLEKIMKVKGEFEVFPFQFSTYPQNIFVTVDGLRSYDNYNIEMQKLTGKITTSDYEDTTNLRKTITVLNNGKEMPIKWSYSYRANEFYFYVDGIERKEKQGILAVSWNGSPINAIASGSQDIIIPALGDFSVSDAKVIDGEDQYVELTFSDPILSGQNLKGIITLQGVDNLTYAIEGNVVKVFLPNRVLGEKLITVTSGIKNFKGYKMNAAYSQTLAFEEPKPLVRIKGNGCILPNSNGLIFPFEAISLKAIDVRVIKIFENNVHQFLQTNNLEGEDGLTRVGKIVAERKIKLDYDKTMNLKQWNKHVIDLGKLISPDPGAIYRISIKFKKEYALCDCEGVEDDAQADAGSEEYEAVNGTQKNTEDKDWNEKDWHSYGSFGGGYDHWYYYDENYSPCSSNYYYGKSVSRNILASDIGLIYKLDDNKMSHAFVSDMITAKPIAGANIEYYDYTKQLIATGTSDANGMLDVQLKRKPFLLLAKFGKQRGYLKLLDGYTNSLSKFDVEGEMVQKGVKGFIYGERGVWRPGDSLFLTFIMEDKEKRLPPNHPVKFELQDPNGTIIYQTTKTKNFNGMYDFRTVTGTEAVTGNYTAIARIGNRTFSQNLKIETVKPNRLKIYMDFANGKENDSTAKLSVKWLHGAIAKNLHAMVNVTVNQSKTTFDKFKGYEFDSPIRNYFSDAEAVFDGNLDEKGETSINTNLAIGQTAPGMLRATYITKVFEEGGDFSIDRYSVPYSPYKTYVGLMAPEKKGYDNTLETGHNYKFDVVTVNEKGKLVNAEKLQVKVYKIQWRWWYERNEEDLANYVSRAGTIVMKDTMINTKEGRGLFNFRVNYPEYGRYLITVSDLNGGHETGKVVYIDWPYWSRGNRSGNENANMLNFACDKEKYTTGENIKLSFPSPSDGMALVSIETGTKVVNKFWIATKKGETTYEFPATKEMSPNAYVHVTLLQPHANTKNDLPIRMYGVVPVLVDEPLSHLTPEIKMLDVIQPESFTKINVKERNGRKMTYTLAMVDEGLLDLTRFKTPQPWNTFYAREALGVKTWDMYDAVIGAYAGKLDKLLSLGGDGEGDGAKGVKANRFKPMVKFMGPFTLEAGQEKNHTVEIPNYVGSVRVMVVAEEEGAYGNAEKAVAVRKPLMILATLPRVLGPQETVYLPVDVFAMENHVKDVKIEVEVNELLTIAGNKTQTMKFAQTGDEVINFKLNVAAQIGIAKVKITATSGKEKTVQEIELDVRTPNPKVVDGMEMVLEPGKEWNTEIAFKGIEGTNKATIEFSSIPSMGLEKRLDYLIQYPHGCIEQTTSSVFPQLYVSNLMEMKESQKLSINNNVKAGLKRLQLFQTNGGGFSYWPGEGYDSEWGTNYAGHFMVEAEKQGYSLPHNMKNKWVKYQQQEARNWNNNNGKYTHPHGNETNEVIQAYRLFVLALSGNAEMGAMNRLREEKNLSATAKWRLAAAYKMVGQNEVALNLIKGLPTDIKPYKELSYSYGSDTRDEAMILETLSLLGEKEKAWPLAKSIAKLLDKEYWMSTQETAYSLLAMCEYTGAKENSGEMSFSYSLNANESVSKSSKKTLYQVKYGDKDFDKNAKIVMKNTGKSTLFAKVIVEGVPLVGDKSFAAKDLKMEVVYKDMKGKEIQPDKLQQGMDFVAEVTITNPGTKGVLKEMALNQIFPSGWEIHNSRMDETGGSNPARYQDIRDDRVYSYYELPGYSSKKFMMQLNATYLGKFYLPTVYSEAMYDNMINARVPGRWVEVVKDLGNIVVK
ncbi:MAG TPA: MG2 domain-containing protein [Bacteroidia bacterium]|nr:MG2 domain-containing protein [Bacteroidia bacterium]